MAKNLPFWPNLNDFYKKMLLKKGRRGVLGARQATYAKNWLNPAKKGGVLDRGGVLNVIPTVYDK